MITGTRLATPNATSVSPVQSISSQEFKLQGRPDTGELLNTLPQIITLSNVDLGSTSNPLSSPGGVSTIDLRGLGPQRTLVLVDGRRLGLGDPNTGNTNPAPDINQIPASLIDRVDVLTGGASATYGSDAVAGVVNFIMKHNFKGVQIDAQLTTFEHEQGNTYIQNLERAKGIAVPKDRVWDGLARDVTVTLGLQDKDAKANFTAYFSYRKQEPVSYSRRDFAACQFVVAVTATASTGSCGGSSNSNIFYDATGKISTQYAVVGNNFNVYSSNAVTSPPPVFNSNPYEYLQHADKRYSGGFFSHYDFNPHLTVYADFGYMKDQALTAVAPAGLFQGSGVTPNAGFLVNCNNPLLSAQEANTICTPAQIASGASVDLSIGRRNIEGGGRTSYYEHENYRIVGGLRGEITGSWKYDVYGQQNTTNLTQINSHYQSLARIQNALQVVTGANGQPVCKSGGSCVPYNIFQTGGVSQAAVDYLDATGVLKGKFKQTVISGSINGDLSDYGLKSPWAVDGLGLALGGEYRKETFIFVPDAASLSGDLSGFGGASTAVNNGYNVKEGFGELRVPLVQQKPMFNDLVLEAGYRYSSYSSGFNTNTFKVGGDWAPVSDLRLRASFQRAIRAPNVIELFLPQSVTNTSVVSSDPCSGNATTPATASLAACMNTGVTAAQYGNGGSTNTIPQCPSGQCAVLNGGNQKLLPERANTYSVGFTFKPSFFSGFNASVDYYHIKLTDQITNVPLAVSLNRCLATGAATFCKAVVRAPNGILFGTSAVGGGYISGTFVNIASQENSGIDVQASYRLGLDKFGLDRLGRLTFDFAGSYLIDAKTAPLPGEHIFNCAGLYGATCQGVFPTWHHTMRATWNAPANVQFSVAWRHISRVGLETNTTDATLGNGKNDTFDAVLGSRDYFDLTMAVEVHNGVTLRAGVSNLFDKDPPLVSSRISGTGTPNAYGIYDLVGRRIFAAVTATF